MSGDQAHAHSAQAWHAAVAETHASAVFFAGDRAYKLKKPVNLGFLDFTTRESRAAACEREVQLNRRFAPDVYLGVAEVRGPAGELCDHLVVMRRMPADRRLSRLVKAHAPVSEDTAAQVRQVARILAAQHAAAARGPRIAEQGGRDALMERWNANLDQMRPFGRRLGSEAAIAETRRLSERFLAGRARLFESRVRAGRVIDGHGDLLADDIFCLDDGPRILDCLDFDDRLRWLDGLDDAAFLAMDLEHLGAADLAEKFTSWYAEFSADPAPDSLLHHYVAYRAFVRAKVSCMRWEQGDHEARADAARFTEQALRHLRQGAVTFVVIGGLPGTGKSALAGELADLLGFAVLSSDRIRKELAGVPPHQPCPAEYGSGIYSPSWTERTYRELLSRAERLLSLGQSVIADASWNAPQRRAAASAVADRAEADLVMLRCAAPADVTMRRLRARSGNVSDADEQIARRMADEEQSWPGAVTIDTSYGACQPVEDAAPPPARPAERALRAIRPYGVGSAARPRADTGGKPAMPPD
ncbi:MAG: AAA family ATPase [Micromonosporaceae bacterium]